MNRHMNRRHFLAGAAAGLLWTGAGCPGLWTGLSAAWAAPAQGSAQAPAQDPGDGFLLLPGGRFLMGSPESERQRADDEVRHEVTLDPFWVDPFEVTQEDYLAVTGKNPGVHRGARLPVENVTWLEAVTYCNALSARRGLAQAYRVEGEAVTWDRRADGYRLLTEAEWEYAARAGTQTVFNVGNQVDSDTVNFEGTYPYLIEENYVTRRDPGVRPGLYRGETMPVDALPPNALGLYHTHGNVSEWVFDYYGPYDPARSANPAGPLTGSLRVNRGGSYIDFGKHLRSACRSATNPLDPDPNLGFRIARNARPLEAVVQTQAPWRIPMPDQPRILVVYFSYSGNTRRAARYLARRLGAPCLELRMQRPYRGNIYEVSQRDLNSRARPALNLPDHAAADLAACDVVLLGYPTWWATMPMPVYSFVEGSDLAGKIVLPFSSHGGTVFGDSVSDLGKALPRSYIAPGFAFHYSGGRRLEAELDAWLGASGIRL